MEGENPNGLTIECCPNGQHGKATLTARLGADVLHVDTLDVTKPKPRQEFTEAICSGCAGIDRVAIKGELLKLAAGLANKTDSSTAEADADELLTKMPEAVRAEACTIMESSDLLQRIVADVSRLGVAGEKELAATIYLIGTSRLLEKPLAAIVQGPSSSGKSYVIARVATMFPPESIIHATQMTPQALFHMKPGSLVHRFVVAGERSRAANDETAETTRALREMLSAGRLVKLMPMKVGGAIETVQIRQDGPIAYVESTTLNKVFDEDANRCILLTTDERAEQTRQIITGLAAAYAGEQTDGDTALILNRHHAMQRMLQPFEVVVPFAARLGELVADDRVEARRAFPQLMSMVQASALLHQRQRHINGDNRLLANRDDYHLARHLVAKPMERLLGGRLSDPAHRFYQRLREWVAGRETFTSADAKKQETGSRSSVYGWLGELHDAGLLELVEAQRGRICAKWRLLANGADREPAASLPTMEQVFGE